MTEPTAAVERLRAAYFASAAVLWDRGCDVTRVDGVPRSVLTELVEAGLVYDPSSPEQFRGGRTEAVVSGDEVEVPGWCRPTRVRSGTGGGGLLAVVGAKWARRATVRPLSRVVAEVGGVLVSGDVVGSGVERGVRVYRVRLGPARVVVVPAARVRVNGGV